MALKKYKPNYKKWGYVVLALIACAVLVVVTKGLGISVLPVVYSKIAMIGSASVASASATKAISEPMRKRVKKKCIKKSKRSPSTTPCPRTPEPTTIPTLDFNDSLLIGPEELDDNGIKSMTARRHSSPTLFQKHDDSTSESSKSSADSSEKLSPLSFSEEGLCFPAFK